MEQLLDLSFDTTNIQIKAYELIGDIFIVYKDYLRAIIYYSLGVILHNTVSVHMPKGKRCGQQKFNFTRNYQVVTN